MPVKLSRLKVMRALPWLDEVEANTVFAKMKAAQESKSCKRFNRRFYNMGGNKDLAEEIRLFRALQLVWESSGSRYRFEEVDDFSVGLMGKSLVGVVIMKKTLIGRVLSRTSFSRFSG